MPILTPKIEPKFDQKTKQDATMDDMDIEVENNSFLDFNTTVSKAPQSSAKNPESQVAKQNIS